MRTIRIIYNDEQKQELIFSTHYLQSVRIENGSYQGVYDKCWIYFDLIKTTESLAKIPECAARNTYKELINFLSYGYANITITLLRADGEEVTDILVKKH